MSQARERVETLVVGGGQAGLAVSHELVRHGVEHIVLVSLAGFGAVIFAGGYRPDYGSWIAWPDAFDDMGFPIQSDGASTVGDGLHFVGVPFLRKRKSPLLFGVGEDATVVASAIAGSVS